MTSDVAVIGGGVAGCAAAALLAEAGVSVRLYEREAIAAGASGRNSGILQHPMDAALAPLHAASLELYFDVPPEPAGVLVVSDDGPALAAGFEAARAEFPELVPEWLEGAALRAAEPALADGVSAYRLATGRPVPPAEVTRAWAARAQAAGATIALGVDAVGARARPSRVAGVVAAGRLEPAGAVVVAAGPWTPAALGAPDWRPVGPLWGVVAQVRLTAPPRHSLEQAGVEGLTAPGGGPASIFSMVTVAGASAVGSTFTHERPDPGAVAPTLLERGARYVPALAGAAIEGVRACARPLSVDGRPLLGPVPGVEGLHLLTGHGPWGLSLGPGSARLVAAAVVGEAAAIPAELAAGRFGSPYDAQRTATTSRSFPLP
jgi:glycine/D-amino acid oxidase-like deaminating enzyme